MMAVAMARLVVAGLPVVGSMVQAGPTFGERTSPNGSSITVEEDFMNAKYPRHILALAARDRTERDGWLVFRCQNNRTEVYFVSGSFEFFGRGRDPVVNVRFPSQDQGRQAPVSPSSDGEAVFFADPIDFIARATRDGSVGLQGSYYSGAFRHHFELDGMSRAAIYEMAETCGWRDRLPEPDTSIASPAEDTGDPVIDDRLRALVGEFGQDRVRAAATRVLGSD
jgi:hypothetical protein